MKEFSSDYRLMYELHVQGNAIRFLSFSYFALEAIVLSVFNNLPQHASDDAYNTIASKFGWGGCMNEGCTSSDKFKLASQLPAQKYGHAYMLPVAGLFVQGLLLRMLAAFLLHWTNRDQQIKPRLSSVVYTYIDQHKRSTYSASSASAQMPQRRPSLEGSLVTEGFDVELAPIPPSGPSTDNINVHEL